MCHFGLNIKRVCLVCLSFDGVWLGLISLFFSLGLVSFVLVWFIVAHIGLSTCLWIIRLVDFGLIWIRLVQFVWLLDESR